MILKQHQSYLEETFIPLRLACIDGGGWPLVVSLWYLYQDGALYCATQADARVVTYLRQNPRCGYEVAADVPPYCGVRGDSIIPSDGVNKLEWLGLLWSICVIKFSEKHKLCKCVRVSSTGRFWP